MFLANKAPRGPLVGRKGEYRPRPLYAPVINVLASLPRHGRQKVPESKSKRVRNLVAEHTHTHRKCQINRGCVSLFSPESVADSNKNWLKSSSSVKVRNVNVNVCLMSQRCHVTDEFLLGYMRHETKTKLPKHNIACDERKTKQESPANAKGTRDSSACMKAHCEQM